MTHVEIRVPYPLLLSDNTRWLLAHALRALATDLEQHLPEALLHSTPTQEDHTPAVASIAEDM